MSTDDLKNKKTNDADVEEVQEHEDDISETEDLEVVEEEETPDEIDVTSIPIDEILKYPDKYTEEVDTIETTDWCPQCSDYTIFVNHICSTCGFTKSINKVDESEDEGNQDNLDMYTADEDLESLGLNYGADEDEEGGYSPY